MENLDYRKYFEDIQKHIEFNINATQFDEAANNTRKALEIICKFYIEKYNITLEEKKNSLHDMVFALEKVFPEDRIQNYYDIKDIGNDGSHNFFVVSQQQAEWAYDVIKEEIKTTLKDMYGNADGLPEGFPSILNDGWVKYNNFSVTGKLENGIYTENIEGIAGVPEFLNKFYKMQDLPRMPITVTKRIIEGTTIKYEGFFEFCKSSFEIDDYIDIFFSRDIEDNIINRFEIKDADEKSIYLYDKFERILEGEWVDNYKEALEIFERTGRDKSIGLFGYNYPQLLLSTLYNKEKLVPFRLFDSWIIPDGKNLAVVNKSTVEVGDILKEEEGKPVYKLKARINYELLLEENADENSKEGLVKKAENFYRLHILRNTLLTLFKKQNQCDNSLDPSAIKIENNEIKCNLMEGFDLGIIEEKDKSILVLYDNYKEKKYEFEIDNSLSFTDLEKNELFEDGLGFEFGEAGISQELISKILEIDGTLKKDIDGLIVDKEKLVAAMFESFKTADFSSKIAKKEEEYKRTKEKEITEKKTKKKKKKGTIIGVCLGIGIPLICILICLGPCVVSNIVDMLPKSLYLNDFCEVKIEGYDGVGTVTLSANNKYNKKYGRKIKYIKGSNHPDNQSAYEYLIKNCTYEIENNGYLKNGDEIVIKWTIDDEALSKVVNYKVKRKDIKYTVSGLETVDFFDAFENFSYRVDGVSSDAELVLESNLNSMEYYGLLYKPDKTENIKNGDLITVSVQTEGGEDLYEYCLDRFGRIPKDKKYTILVEGLPEYVTDFEQLTEDFIDGRISVGEERLKLKYEDRDYVKNISYEYIGNYFLSSKSSDEETKNKLIIVYRVKTQGKWNDYEFYEVYGAWNIYSDGEELSYKLYDDPNPNVYKEGWSDRYYGVEKYDEIYGTFIEPNSEAYYIQNNMKE